MEFTRIIRTHAPPLEFDGGLLDRQAPEATAGTATRWHTLSLYVTADGHFVPVYEYHTTCPTEQGVIEAELVDDVIGVESFYFSHEPNAQVDEAAINSLSRKTRQQDNKVLFQDYDRQSEAIVGAARRHQLSHSARADTAPRDDSTSKRTFFGWK